MNNLIKIESKLAKNRTPIERLMLAVSYAAATKIKPMAPIGEHQPSGSKLSRKATNGRVGTATIR